MNEPIDKEFFVQDLVYKANEIASELDIYLKTIQDQYTDADILEFVKKYYDIPTIIRIPFWKIIFRWGEIFLKVEFLAGRGGGSDIDTIEIKYLINSKELDKLVAENRETKKKKIQATLDQKEKEEREQLQKLKEKYETPY